MSAEVSFKRRLDSAISTVLAYEDKAGQAAVREHIDFEAIFQYLCEEQEKQALERKSNPRSIEELSIIAIMRWFKCDFFKWCNKPACDNLDCDGRPQHMESEGMATPTLTEERDGGASRVEVYRCKLCHRVTRFPRYNNVMYMMKHSRRGRCGEFANVFGMVLRSLGFDVRYVLDFTDHVWVEVWIEALQRFVHCDPCERALDAPLGYEAGWKKKLTHVLSCSRYGVDDAISRYTREQDEVLIRRGMEYPEDLVQQYIALKDSQLEARFASNPSSTASLTFHSDEFPASLFERFSFGKSSFENLPELPVEVMMTRRLLHKADLESMMFLRPGHLSVEEQHGRTSGDLAWRQQRGEINQDEAKVEAMTLPTIDENAVCGVDENALCTTGHDRSESIILQNLWRQAKDAGRFSWFMNVPGLILSQSNALDEIMFQLPFQSHMSNYRLQLPSTSYSMTISIQNMHFPVRKEGVHVYFISNLYHALYSEDSSLDDDLLNRLFVSSSSSSSDINGAITPIITSAINSSYGGVLLVHIDSRESLSLYPRLVEGLKNMFHISHDVMDQIMSDNKFYIIATAQNGSIVPHSVQVLYRSSLALTSITGAENSAQISTEILPCMAKVWVKKQPAATIKDTINTTLSFCSDSLVKLENHLCSNVSEVILAEESDSLDTLQAKAMAALLSDPERSLIGFTIVPDASNHNLLQSALLFAADHGLSSWKMMKGAHSYVLSASTLVSSSSSSSATSGPAIPDPFHTFDSSSVQVVTYHDVGGGSHGDTLHFDGTDLVTSSHWSLSHLDLWAGESLSNGIQCRYRKKTNMAMAIDPEEWKTPIFTSSEGSPIKYSLSLLPLAIVHSSTEAAAVGHSSPSELEMKKIAKLVVHAGALIDGLKLETNDGSVLSVGGNGGDRIQINLDERHILHGFYGGCGGHLHNLGVVMEHVLGNVQVSPHSPVISPVESLLPDTSLEPLYERHGFYDQTKYLNSVQFDNFHVTHCQHNNLPALSRHLRSLLRLNSDRRVVVTALQTLIAYLKNIHKNPLEEKYQTMKLRNTVVGRILAAKGMLPLVGFGPAAFHVSSDGLCLQSRWKKIMDRLPQQLSRKDLIRSLKAFIDCLSEITTMVERLL